jgi:hypothetical protein
MIDDIKVIACRRSYEFRVDDLRLATLTTPFMQQVIATAFAFQATALTTIPPIFAPVLEGSPPGVVFQTGIFTSETGEVVPIRMLLIELRRIVIDAPVTPVVFDKIFDQLRRVVVDAPVMVPNPAIGEPERRLDYSELSARFEFRPEDIFVPELRGIFGHALGATAQEGGSLVPTVSLQMAHSEAEFSGVVAPAAVFAIRAGTKPSDHVYFSAAFLDMEAHRYYLLDLAEAHTST